MTGLQPPQLRIFIADISSSFHSAAWKTMQMRGKKNPTLFTRLFGIEFEMYFSYIHKPSYIFVSFVFRL